MLRMTLRPSWLRPTQTVPFDTTVLDQILEFIEAGEHCWIQGPQGSSKTQVLAAVATRTDRPLVAVRLAGCRDEDDILLALGWVLQSVPCGTEQGVIASARALQQPLFLLDDADIGAIDNVLSRLQHQLPEATWICASVRQAPRQLNHHTMVLPPRPLPSIPSDLDLAATLTSAIHPALLLASLPAGLPHLGPLPDPILLVNEPNRQIMRPSMIEALKQHLPSPGQVALELYRVYHETLHLAAGGPICRHHCWEDALTLRWMGEVLADPDQACVASAAAARMLVSWGQQASAGRVIDAAQRRNSRARPKGLGLLSWADANRSLAQGDMSGATRHFEEASRHFHDGGEDALLARLAQHRADSNIQRAQAKEAVHLLRTARRLLTVLNDTASISSTLRSAAELAVVNGEYFSAETLFDQATGAQTPAQENMARRIGTASLAIGRADFDRARKALNPQGEEHDAQILIGNRFRRLADIALRESQVSEGRKYALRALRAYSRGGAHVAMAHTIRLLGDISILAGDIPQAWRHYRNAVERQLEVHDYAALSRTVSRLEFLERAAGRSVRANELREAGNELRLGRS